MEQFKKPKILVFCDFYLPGYKSGGGMRAMVNMVDRLNEKFDFYIVTRDHDGVSDKNQYTTVKINEWNMVGGAQVFYLSKDKVRISKIRELIFNVKADLIYTNSYFATLTIYVLQLRKLGLIPNINIIISPCGELSEGALRLKAGKKKLFIGFSKISQLYKNIIWKASTELEKAEIEKIKGKGGEVFIAPDLPPKSIIEDYKQELKPRKISGEANMVFLSRFMRKKNFKWLLEYLPSINGSLNIDIYGPLEDQEYWEECESLIKKLPSNIKVEAKGSIPYEEVIQTLFNYHFFILPTLGENFGYVFIEALAVGCPLIISDRTPWLSLENDEIGWALPLENPEKWLKTLNYCINLDNVSYSKLSDNARKYASNWLENSEIEEMTLSVLKYGLESTLGNSAKHSKKMA
ncbi:MAG: glycosyltransferase [Pyrinomonadaceae bacterium]